MKKEMYYFDERLNNEMVKAHEFLLPALNDLLKAYNRLELGKLTTKKLHLLIKNPGKVSDEIYFELRDELKKSNLPAVIREATRKIVAEKVAKITDAVNEVRRMWEVVMNTRLNQAVRIEWEYYTILNDTVIFPSVSQQKIKEACSYFIENDSQRKAISCINQVNMKFQELKEILEKSEIKIPVQVADNDHFGALRRNENGLVIIPEVLMKIKE
jgi:hypothetical protein